MRPPALLARWLLPAVLLLATNDSRAQKAAPAKPPAAAAPNQEAKALFEKGLALSGESRWAEALEAFEASYKLAPVPVVQYNIAYNLRTLGRYVEAKQRLQLLIDASRDPKSPGATPLKPALKQDIDQLFAEVKEKVVRLTVRLDPPDGELQVDGTVTRLPPDGVLEFDPGKHVFVVKKEGFETTSVTRTLSSTDTEMQLRAPARKTETRVVEREKVVESPDRPFYTRAWFWTVTGVVVLGGATAIYIVTRPGDPTPLTQPPSRTVDRIIPTAIHF